MIVSRRPGVVVASLVLGVLSLFLVCFTGIPAVVCGHIGLSRIKKSAGRETGAKMAVTGLVLGYFGIALTLAYVIFVALAPSIIKGIKQEATENKLMFSAKILYGGCKEYAAVNNGLLPDELSEIEFGGYIDQYLDDSDSHTVSSLFEFPAAGRQLAELTAESKVLVSKDFALDQVLAVQVVCYGDGSVAIYPIEHRGLE